MVAVNSPGRTRMTPSVFRKLALSLPDTEEREHMKHPDFRVHGKIFATLAYPSKEFGMVELVAGATGRDGEGAPENVFRDPRRMGQEGRDARPPKGGDRARGCEDTRRCVGETRAEAEKIFSFQVEVMIHRRFCATFDCSSPDDSLRGRLSHLVIELFTQKMANFLPRIPKS